ncbi:unnamed protein product [Euphydryas editha]|uniref:Retrovirus-related Pol polyprotein from transposon TNT 1-94-like beta-barrel domain-containing protein n=1 Tax=Euphydryas editha TaxID=104508 RepID=A0AAU9V6M8_EUPED|nr:unnamed protein product [Euphydryas editha]
MAESSEVRHYGSFEKLEGIENYNNWKFLMRMALTLEGHYILYYYACVDGSLNDVEKDKRALARICLSVKPCCLQYVRNLKTCKEAWDSLANVFEDKGFYRRVMLLRKLHRTQFEDFSSMSAYIEGIMTLIQQLSDIGKNTEDAEIAEILLSGLPSEYDMLVSSLESAIMTKLLTSDLVKTRLLQEEMRKKATDGNNDMALISKQSTGSTSKFVCHYCHKPGHIKYRCFKLRKEWKSGNDSKNEKFDVQQALLSVVSESGSHRQWIVDSGATAHMCNDTEWFQNFRQYKEFVTVANNEKLLCLGRGDVCISLGIHLIERYPGHISLKH